MKILFLVGTGSFIGGIARYAVTMLINNRYFSSFPFGTLAVNVTGCFLIGIVYGLTERGSMNPDTRIFLATGILGGFTTFSSFSHESITLLRSGQYLHTFFYIGLSVIAGLAATVLGIILVKSL